MRMRQAPRRTCGAVLFEAILALGLLLIATGTIVSGLTAATESTVRVRREARANDLLTSVSSRLDIGRIPLRNLKPRKFQQPFEDWSFEVAVTPKAFRESNADDDRISRFSTLSVEIRVRLEDTDFERSLTRTVLVENEDHSESVEESVPGERLERVRELLAPPKDTEEDSDD